MHLHSSSDVYHNFIIYFSYSIVCVVPCPRLPYNEPGTTYTVLKYPEEVHASVATIPTTLRFIARDCDPATGIPDADQGYHDEYMVRNHYYNIKMKVIQIQ
jgi:coatomer protein complex subunit gamma